jgi:magnesium-transporting ATPase (P-type)
MFERDLDDLQSLKYPQLYKAGHQRYYFNLGVFWRWVFLSMIHGGLCYAFTMIGMSGPQNESGKTNDHWMHSTYAFTIIIHIVNYKLFIETSFWNSVTVGAGVISIMLYYLMIFGINFQGLAEVFAPELADNLSQMFSSWKLVIGWIMLPFLILTPDIVLKLN